MIKKVDLLPPKSDYVFARLFGARSHKRVLICLLNSILNGKPQIKDITLDPTEYKKVSPDGKSIRLDIAATSDDGTHLHIEMQCINEGDIGDRASFYQARLREPYLKEGQNYSSIPDIISIWIVAEPVTKRKSCVHEIVSMYKDNGVDPIEIASEKMRQFIIELTKLEATPKRFLNDMFTIWLLFIRDPESIPAEFLEIPEVKEAMDELTYMSADKKTRAEYDARIKELNGIRAALSTKYDEGKFEGEKIGIEKGEKIGIEKGEKIGVEKGRAEEREKAAAEKVKMLKNMLEAGLSIEQVSEISELCIDEIKKIK